MNPKYDLCKPCYDIYVLRIHNRSTHPTYGFNPAHYPDTCDLCRVQLQDAPSVLNYGVELTTSPEEADILNWIDDMRSRLKARGLAL